jgi:hypothetical protein
MHYTSRADILLIVEPVLMAPLRRRWEAVQAQARDLAAQRDAIPDSLDRALQRRRAGLTGEINTLVQKFDVELSAVCVLDPACGAPRGAGRYYPNGTNRKEASLLP